MLILSKENVISEAKEALESAAGLIIEDIEVYHRLLADFEGCFKINLDNCEEVHFESKETSNNLLSREEILMKKIIELEKDKNDLNFQLEHAKEQWNIWCKAYNSLADKIFENKLRKQGVGI